MMISWGEKVSEWQSKMFLNIIGRFLYWTAWTLQLTSARYCKKRKRYVQHRWFYYKVFVTLVKIALLSVDIPDVVLIVISAHRMEFDDNIMNFLLLGQCFLWLSRLYALMALICLTHLDYYQRRIMSIQNKILNISKELESNHSEKHTSCCLLVLLVLAIIRLMLDLWTKLGLIVHLTCTMYYNTLFCCWYLGLGLFQTKLVEWRRELVMFLKEFTENEGHRSRIEVDRLLSCLRVNYSIFELQMSFYKVWKVFSCILPLLLLNFVDLWNVSLALHFVSISILCHISDEGKRLENQFLNLIFVTSLRYTRGDPMVSKEYAQMVHKTVVNLFLKPASSEIHQQLSKRYAFCLSLHFFKFATLYFLVLKANQGLEKLSHMQLRYAYDDEESILND